MDHITFDIETLGGRHSTQVPIVQIAAVKFTETGDTLDTFNNIIDLEKLDRYRDKFQVDFDTLKWWFSQEHSVIKKVMCSEEGIDLRQALRNFLEWIDKPSQYYYWTHATFDPPILKYNLLAVGLPNPIPYRLHRDIRTLTHFTGIITTPFEGEPHNAIDDALYQARYISQGLKFMSI